MKEPDFYYKDEIKEILVEAWKLSVKMKKLISPEMMAYSIIQHYINVGGEDEVLGNEINKLNSTKKEDLKKRLLDLIDSSKADSAYFNAGWWENNKFLPLKDELTFAFMDAVNWTKAGEDDDTINIGTAELLHSLAMSNSAIGNILHDFDIQVYKALDTETAMSNYADKMKDASELSESLSLKGATLMKSLDDNPFKPGSSSSFGAFFGSLLDAINSSKLKAKKIGFDDGGIISSTNSENENDEDDEDEEENDGEVFNSSSEALNPREVDKESKTPTLDQFALDMTKKAEEGGYDPLIGREKELEQIIEILSCRKKSNAMLLGDPGCGKTAIVEGLAQRIVNKTVPLGIQGKRLLSLNLNDLVAGTKHRGDLEDRMKLIISELTTFSKDIILFLDECHTALGVTNSSSSDIANILKPYLSRGEFQCIGSTTLDEYRKYIEKDKAIVRRFQNILVNEVSSEETARILRGVKEKYETFHNVKVKDGVIDKIVEWSGRYIYDRYFPDKAIDVLDLASARAKLNNLEKLGVGDKLRSLNKELITTKEKLKKLVKNQAFEDAAKERDKEEEIKKKIDEVSDSSKICPEITLDDVARVIEKISGVPIDQISSTDMSRLKTMKNELSSKVIGQDEAIKEVVLSLQRNILGLRDENKPIASFLFVGQTGCGKTYISKMIAELFMGSPASLIKIDMGNYTEDNAVTGLLGSPASYIGYDDEPALLAVKRKRNAVVLFDEIEKASQSILNSIFLSILDEGYVTLSNGTKVSFKDSIVVFTGNIGTKDLAQRGTGIGFSKSDEDIKSQVESVIGRAVDKQFTPEFLNRLSKIVIFNPLGKEELDKIFDLELDKLKTRLGKQGYSLSVSEDVKKKIIEDCDLKYGARDLQRGITKYVETEICETMLKDSVDVSKKNIKVTDKEVVFED